MTSLLTAIPTIVPHGKFFLRGDQKFFFRAMRLADFGSVLDFDEKLRLLRRLEEIRHSRATALLLTEQQAELALNLAVVAGLYAMVELSVQPEELIRRRALRTVAARLEQVARSLAGRPGLIGFLIDCEIGQDALRAYGFRRIRESLRTLVRLIHDTSSIHCVVAIRHRLETRALAIEEEDIVYTDVTGLGSSELRKTVLAIHNVADSRPVVVEVSGSLPLPDEAIACSLAMGVAGVVTSAVSGSASAFAAARPEAGPPLAFSNLNGAFPPAPANTPMVSIVICAYNAVRTLRQCLDSLARLDYPNYEVLIVDDGSRDRSAEIAGEFPSFRLIRQRNKGLSVARNVGLQAARGQIIAYTDSDCVVDPHWLAFMVRVMTECAFDACGGPNYAPHEDGRLQACVAASPGAPCHVLMGEDEAEHLAGCNMVFSREPLTKVGGFDPQFTAAGDDVDIIWRMLDAGMKVGFCPAAFVWHFRRNTIKAYYGQQRGYGRAEAMLYLKYPARFNVLGQIRWRGRIPGLDRMLPGGDRKRIWWEAPAAAPQTVEAPPTSLLAFLPQTLEWNLAWTAIAIVSALAGLMTLKPALAMLAAGPLWAIRYARRARIERCHSGLVARLIIVFLAYTGPFARTIERWKTRLKLAVNRTPDSVPRQRPAIGLLGRSLALSYWNETYVTREVVLERLIRLLTRLRYPVAIESGWRDFDLEVKPGLWTRLEIKTADEEHGGRRLKNHVLVRIRLTVPAQAALFGSLASIALCGALGNPTLAFAAAALTLAGGICLLAVTIDSARTAYRAIEQIAEELGLMPLGKAALAALPPRWRCRAFSGKGHSPSMPANLIDISRQAFRAALRDRGERP